MKTLFLLILVPIILVANTRECELALTKFDNSVKQKKTVSDGVLMMTIVYCEDLPQYRQVLMHMMDKLDTGEM